ncbi:MAG: ABC-F family ATP-binding cassette domain-containing protein [Anaerolineaceae bacterium]|nr:ABC-F family ATP-binding cassette domain-containing protein [Anaerolineaceae bacterium]
MIAIRMDQVAVIFGTDPIFESLSWEIHDDRCVGLIGPNGCGKSTLLKLINGTLSHDGGFLSRQKGIVIGYLEQEPEFGDGQSVWNELMAANQELSNLEMELNQIEKKLADPEVYENEKKLTIILNRQTHLLDEYTALGGPGFEGFARSTLLNLGFSEGELYLPVEALSGGQKKLLGLARLLVTRPNLLLLDEPDNHLDLESKQFLEKFIRNFKGGVVIVSHDRYLLDMVVDKIVELEDGRLTEYPGNYSEYAFEKELRLQRQQQLFQAQQKEINRLEMAAKRLLTWGRVYDNVKFIKRGKSILKRLDKIDRIGQPVLDRKRMGLELKGHRGSDKVLEIGELFLSFPSLLQADEEDIILAGVNLLVRRGDRLGMVGPNGAGKSLLFRVVLDQIPPTDGEITLGPSVKVGYYAQQHETLDDERTLLDTVREAGRFSENNGVAFLRKFLFTYEQARSQISTLSGGERSRLQMALLMLSGANFLLLDEPTNNLDIASIEVLEEALEDFNGTVFTISHDRYFLDRVVDRIVELDEGVIENYLGNYSDYCERKEGNI